MQSFEHENLVQYYQSFVVNTDLWIVLELMDCSKTPCNGRVSGLSSSYNVKPYATVTNLTAIVETGSMLDVLRFKEKTAPRGISPTAWASTLLAPFCFLASISCYSTSF